MQLHLTDAKYSRLVFDWPVDIVLLRLHLHIFDLPSKCDSIDNAVSFFDAFYKCCCPDGHVLYNRQCSTFLFFQLAYRICTLVVPLCDKWGCDESGPGHKKAGSFSLTNKRI